MLKLFPQNKISNRVPAQLASMENTDPLHEPTYSNRCNNLK